MTQILPSSHKLKCFLFMLVATTFCTMILLHYSGLSLMATKMWIAPLTDSFSNKEGRKTSNNSKPTERLIAPQTDNSSNKDGIKTNNNVKPTEILIEQQTDNSSQNEGGETNKKETVSKPGYHMVFNRDSPYPYFYKPITYHSSDKNRQKMSYSVNFSDGYRPVNSTKTKRILFYKPPGWYRNSQDHCRQGLKKCPQKNCECLLGPSHIDKADVVIFDLTELNLKKPPARKPNQVWAMFGKECPFYYSSHLYKTEPWRNVFNWTMTYRLDSDIIYPYGVFYHQEPPLKADFSKIALNKTKSVLWFVSNCNTPSKRQQYVKELRKHNISVDMYGNCGPLKCRGPHCDGMYNEYRFYLSFENSPCFDYFTEKLFKVYSHNIVPVVRGGADYSSLIPPGTYINAANFSSPQELAKHLKYLEQNVTAYAEILERKSRYIQSNGDQLESAYCDFCVKIHNLDLFHQQYYDIGKWLTQETCHV